MVGCAMLAVEDGGCRWVGKGWDGGMKLPNMKYDPALSCREFWQDWCNLASLLQSLVSLQVIYMKSIHLPHAVVPLFRPRTKGALLSSRIRCAC